MKRLTLASGRRALSRLRARVAPKRRLRRLLGRPEPAHAWAAPASGSPADFEQWIDRLGGRVNGLVPEAWKSASLNLSKPARVGVVMHVFYVDLVAELLARLASIPVPFDLIVTNASGQRLDLDTTELINLRDLRVLEVANHGRDILPLIHVVNAGLLDPYELVLKVHTKKSAWRQEHQLSGSGDEWRTALLDELLGTTDQVSRVLAAFAADRDLGMVSATGSVLGPDWWGDNQATAASLLRRLELPLDESRLVFAAGSMYWTRGFVLQGLRALNVSAHDFEAEAGQVNATTAHALERVIGLLVLESGQDIRETSALPADLNAAESAERWGPQPLEDPRVRVIPFYLPQFHPIPENDDWWGQGFTEWSNVVRARPVFQGQYQPRLPTDLGFYDLRLDETRTAQAELARGAGVHGFMYYHYWFAGKQLLEGPVEALVERGPDFPFAIMWANENWTRRWDGRANDILIGQDYEHVPADTFIDDVMHLLEDPRYIRVDGKCLVSIYRPGQLENLPSVIAAWRRRAAERGLSLYLLGVDVAKDYDAARGSTARNGLDGLMAFPPHNHLWSWLPYEDFGVDGRFGGNLLSYRAMVEDAEKKFAKGIPDDYIPGVMVTFDNTARRQWAGDVWYGSNPYTFRRWLEMAARAVESRPADSRIVFVNAWNEWAEGAVLEPTDRFGRTFLLAVRDVSGGAAVTPAAGGARQT